MRFVIYGPPGAGKSTLARLIPTKVRDATVVHLERVPGKQRLPLLLFLGCMDFDTPLFITAADLSPEAIPRDLFNILLLLPEPFDAYWEQYERRNREEGRPHQEVTKPTYMGMRRRKEQDTGRFRLIVNPLEFEGPAQMLHSIMEELKIPATMG